VPKKYIEMKIDEISSVDTPANGKEFLIIKNVDEEPDKGGEDNMDELTLEKALELVEDENARTLIEDAISKNENTEPEDNNEPEEIEKNELPEAIQKKLEKMESELNATKEIAKKEREKRLDIEFRKKAETYDQVAETEKIATVLRKAHDADFGEELEEILKSANTRLEEGDFTKEIGDGGEDITDASNELEKRAQEIRKNNPELSNEQAMTKALEEDPKLYMDYLNQ